MRPREDAKRRFRCKVRRNKISGCWNWLSHRDHRGYGRFWNKGRSHPAHRWAYEQAWFEHGAMEGWPMLTMDLELDHLCGNRRCVNPEHLQPVSHEENMSRMMQRRRQKKLEETVEKLKRKAEEKSRLLTFGLRPNVIQSALTTI